MIESMSSTATAPYSSTCAASLGDYNLVGAEQALEGYEEAIGDLAPHWEPTMEEDCSSGTCETIVMDPEDAPAEGVPHGSECQVSSNLDILPSTCTAAGMLATDGGCSMQLPLDSVLGTPDLNLQIAMGTCPSSLLPFFSLRIGGAGATKLLAPCSSDDQCGEGHVCFDLFSLGIDGPETGGLWDEFARAFLETVEYQGDMDAANAAIAAADIGSALMTTIRKFYDNQAITLASNQLLPVCLPQGGATGLFDWDPAGGTCADRFEEGYVSCWDLDPYSECEQLGCTVQEGGEWNGWAPECVGEATNVPQTDCEGIGGDTDACQAELMCSWEGNGGIAIAPERLLESIEIPLNARDTSFTAGGITWQCGEHCDEGMENPECAISEWVASANGYSKCASAGYAGYSAQMFVAQTLGDAGACTRYTTLDLTGILEPWDGTISDGTSVFALKTAPSIIPASMTLDDTWFTSTCDGLFVGRISDTLFGAIKIPALLPIFERFADIYRTVILTDAAAVSGCITDEQIQSFFNIWSPQFWLTAVSAWGPTADNRPPLLPSLESVGKQLMEEIFEGTRDDSACPLACNLDDGSCYDYNCDIPPWVPAAEQAEYPAQYCGWTPNRDAVDGDGVPCLGDGFFPSVALPSTCTAAGYSAEPSLGCAASYDLTWATGGATLSVDVAVTKCVHNPLSLSATQIKCGDDDTTSLCDYGRNWCNAATPCTSSADTCEVFPEELLASDAFDEESDPVSMFMGTEELQGTVSIAASSTYSMDESNGMFVLLAGEADWLSAAAAARPDIFGADGFVPNDWPMDAESYADALIDATGMEAVIDSRETNSFFYPEWDPMTNEETYVPDEALTFCSGATEPNGYVALVATLLDQPEPAFSGVDCQWYNYTYQLRTRIGWETLALRLGQCQYNTAGADACTYEGNVKVPGGPLAKELINFARTQFGDAAYGDLPVGLGYCLPEDPVVLDEAESDVSGEDEGGIVDTLFQFDDEDKTLIIAGLNSGSVPAGLGDAGVSAVSMTPPYGQETCGLVQVTEVVIPAVTSIPGAVSTEALQTALATTAPAGATVTITSVETTVESSFSLPDGTAIDDAAKDALRQQIATTYGGVPSQVKLDGVRRRRRRLQVAVTYTFTTTEPLQSPDTSTLTSAITTATGVSPESVADPAAATVASEVQYFVTVPQDAGAGTDEAAALATSMTNTAALVTALDGQVTDAGGQAVDTNTLTAGVAATAEAPVVVMATTTTEAAAAMGVETAAAVAAPVPCAGSWSAFGDCTVTCGGGTQSRTYSVVAEALNGGADCPEAAGATESQACNAAPCISQSTSSPSPAPGPAPVPAPVPAPGPAPSTSGASIASFMASTITTVAVIALY